MRDLSALRARMGLAAMAGVMRRLADRHLSKEFALSQRTATHEHGRDN